MKIIMQAQWLGKMSDLYPVVGMGLPTFGEGRNRSLKLNHEEIRWGDWLGKDEEGNIYIIRQVGNVSSL